MTTWKEVAEYLGVSVRTAQNWERERRLPVTRLPGPGRGRIIVTLSDLERWKFSGAALAAEDLGPRAPKRRLPWGAAAAVLLLAGGLAAWTLSRSGPAPASFRIDQGSLVVCDQRGRELWRRSFERPLIEQHYTEAAAAGRRRFWAGDLDGDGRQEVLFVEPGSLDETGSVICYSAGGSEKWRFQPSREVATRKEGFRDRYYVANFVVAPVGDGGSPAVVVASVHMLLYPSQVALLSPTGAILGEYWHSGHLYRIAAPGPKVYLGGISNSHKAATLVVLDREHFSGASVEVDADYQLLGMPPATEAARVLFPRTCISRKFEEYNFPASLTVDRESITAIIAERYPPSAATMLFHFTPGLRLAIAGFADSFRSYHADLRSRGQLDHDLSAAEQAAIQSVITLTASSRPR